MSDAAKIQLFSEYCSAKGHFLMDTAKDESILFILCYLNVHPITLPTLMLGTENDSCDNRCPHSRHAAELLQGPAIGTQLIEVMDLLVIWISY